MRAYRVLFAVGLALLAVAYALACFVPYGHLDYPSAPHPIQDGGGG